MPKSLVLLLAVIVVIAGIGVGIYISGPINSSNPPVASQDFRSEPVITAPLTVRAQPLTFPTTKSSKTISKNLLPQDIQFLVIPAGQDVKIEQLSFVNGLEGYQIAYAVKEKKLDELHRGFQRLLLSGGWKILNSSRSDADAKMDADSKDYKLTIAENINPQGIIVSIKIQRYE